MFVRKLSALAAVSLIVANCATGPEEPTEGELRQRTTDEVVATTQQPLEDINVLQDEIPQILLDVRDDPYAPPVPENCQILIAEIQKLDVALGADVDLGPGTDPTTLDTSFAVARSLALSLIPFRGIAREVSGAEAYAREVSRAILAGTVRRAYFKGIGSRLGCGYPGSPRR